MKSKTAKYLFLLAALCTLWTAQAQDRRIEGQKRTIEAPEKPTAQGERE